MLAVFECSEVVRSFWKDIRFVELIAGIGKLIGLGKWDLSVRKKYILIEHVKEGYQYE